MRLCKIEGSMMSHIVHSCIIIKIIEIRVWTVIVWLFMHIITFLEYERLDVLFTNYFQCSIIKMAAVVIIEDHLGG